MICLKMINENWKKIDGRKHEKKRLESNEGVGSFLASLRGKIVIREGGGRVKKEVRGASVRGFHLRDNN